MECQASFHSIRCYHPCPHARLMLLIGRCHFPLLRAPLVPSIQGFTTTTQEAHLFYLMWLELVRGFQIVHWWKIAGYCFFQILLLLYHLPFLEKPVNPGWGFRVLTPTWALLFHVTVSVLHPGHSKKLQKEDADKRKPRSTERYVAEVDNEETHRRQDMVSHSCSPSTWEVEVRR